MATVNTSDNRYGVAQLIVAPTIAEGANFTTIAAALTAASSGQTIFIRPGTYTENLTLKAGVNLTAFGCDSSLNATGHVIISGNATLTAAGSVTISGIQLQTNSAAFLTVSGSAASIVNLFNCYLNCTNATGISFTSSSASAEINVEYCEGNLGTTGIAIYSSSSAGIMQFRWTRFENTGLSSTATTQSAGTFLAIFCRFNSPLAMSSTSTSTMEHVQINSKPVNTTCFAFTGTATITISGCSFESGTASALSVGAGTVVIIGNSYVASTNTNAITGAGSISAFGISFSGSSTNNVTTQTISGTLQGSKNTTPTAGMLGETIASTLSAASGITLSNNTAADITSINLTPGIWDISSLGRFSGTITGTAFSISISATTATRGAEGADNVSPTAPTAASGTTHPVPSFRVLLTANATYYLVGFALFSAGTLKGFGRIAATRVG